MAQLMEERQETVLKHNQEVADKREVHSHLLIHFCATLRLMLIVVCHSRLHAQ